MKFRINRTSSSGDNKPINGAVREKHLYINRVVQDVWVIGINTLDEVLKLINDIEYPIIIGTEVLYEGIEYSIEIYNGYME